MTKTKAVRLAGVSTLAILAWASGACAQVAVSGDVDPAGPPPANWFIPGDLTVGNTAPGTLSIAAGGTVNNLFGFIGRQTGATGTATVSGAGAIWTNGNDLSVGGAGTGTLTVSGQGQVSDVNGYVADLSGSTGTATVTGSGSSWSNSGDLFVGGAGTGGLTISAGGAVSNVTGRIGRDALSSGSVTVDGSGSTWTNSGDLLVGASGDGDLTVQAGGAVTSATGYVADQGSSTGDVVVTGATSTWTLSNDLFVGNRGTGTLRVDTAGTVSNGRAFLGNIVGSSGTATVSGLGSTWASTGDLVVGRAGSGTLEVEAGGAVTNAFGYIADQTGSTGAATVSGGGSVWTNSGNLIVGNFGDGTLTVNTGGTVNDTIGFLGYESGSTGGALVTGLGSAWANTGNLVVGRLGGGTLTVAAGGTVTNAGGFVGDQGGSTGTATVTGSNSTWTSSGDLIVGNSGTGTLTVAAGGTVGNADGLIGNLFGSTGGATVTGSTSTWASTGDLFVGGVGSGALAVEAGGAVSNTQGTIGDQAGSTGVATVTGVGSTWTNTGGLLVGNAGAGTLTVAAGGIVSAGTVTIASAGSSDGTLNIGAAAGNTAVSAGTLQVGTLAFGAGNGTLVFNHADNVDGTRLDFAPILTGNGTIDHLAGRTVFSGVNTGLASYTGTTDLSGGTLFVNGTFGDLDAAGGLYEAQLNVSGSGTLSGSGIVAGDATFASGATLAPGNSPGTLTILGDATFAAGSTYRVEAASNGDSDRLVVGGTATLGGADVSVVALDPDVSYRNGQAYTILSAGTVAGAFAAPTILGGSAFLTPSLTYDASTVVLNIATLQTPDPAEPALFTTVAQTPNQFATATGLDGLPQVPGSAALALYNAILFSNAPNARIAFDQLSGEVHASDKTGRIEDARFLRNTAFDRLDAAFTVLEEQGSDPVEGSVALASTGIEAWISGYGSWGETDGNGNAASLDRDIGGFLVGADGFLTETLRVGLLAGYSEASYDVDGRGSSADVDSTHVGLYAGTLVGPVELKAGASYSFSEIDTSRQVSFGAFRDRLTSSYDGGTAQVFGEASYRIDVAPGAAISPFANLAYVSLDTDGFSESGGAASLTSGDDTMDTTFSTLGLKGSTALALGGLAVKANATLGWRHAFDDRTPTETLAFVAGGPAFVVSGEPIAEDAAVVEVGFGVDVAPNATLGVHYAGQFGDDAADNGVRATFDVKF